VSITRRKCSSQKDVGASGHLLLQTLTPFCSFPNVPIDKFGSFRLQVGVDAAQGTTFVDGRLHKREAGNEGGREGGRDGGRVLGLLYGKARKRRRGFRRMVMPHTFSNKDEARDC